MEPKEYELMYQEEERYWWFVVKRFFIKTLLKKLKLKKEQKILDIGCGTGKNLEILSSFGKVWGIDISPLALNFCQKRGFKNLKRASVEKTPFKNRAFGLITLFDVLYHKGIKDDRLALKEIYRVLEKGGYLLLTDCAYNFLFGPHDIAVHARQRYTRGELNKKIKKTGFKILKSSYIFFFPFLFFVIDRLLSKFFIPKKRSTFIEIPKLANQIFILMGKLESWLLQFLNFPFGSSIIILAKKE